MILLGDSLVPFEKTFMIYHKDQIVESEPNATILFNYNREILQYVSANDIAFAPIISNITDAIYANALGAKYIVVKPVLAKEIQNLAENYMFDSKVLAIISDASEIEAIAKDEIDGVIYRDLLE